MGRNTYRIKRMLEHEDDMARLDKQFPGLRSEGCEDVFYDYNEDNYKCKHCKRRSQCADDYYSIVGQMNSFGKSYRVKKAVSSPKRKIVKKKCKCK